MQAKLISAILMGTRLPIDKGKETGLFKTIPQCQSPTQTGCVIAYSSFRDTIPPPANSRFGKAPSDTQVAACENPAALGGGKADLHAYLSKSAPISGAAGPMTVWVKGKANPTTPFISVPGLLTGQCVDKNGFSYLEVHVNAVPSDPRTDTIEGDVVSADGKISEDWGLHLIDANLVMGNLVDVVGSESKAWLAKTASSAPQATPFRGVGTPGSAFGPRLFNNRSGPNLAPGPRKSRSSRTGRRVAGGGGGGDQVPLAILPPLALTAMATMASVTLGS